MQITLHNWKNHHLNESLLVLTTITSTMLVRTSAIRGTPCKSGWRSPPRAVPINIPTWVQTPRDTWILLCTWHLYTCIYSSVQFLCTNFNHGTAHEVLVSSLSTMLIDFLWCERTWSHGHSLCKLTPSTWPANGVYGHHLEVLEGHYHIHFCHDESTRGGVGKHCFIELLDEWIPHKTFSGSTVSYYSERSRFKLVLAHTIKVTRAIPQCVQDKPWPTVFCPLGQIHIVCPKHQIFGFLS